MIWPLDKPKCVPNDVGIETNSCLSSCLVSLSRLSLLSYSWLIRFLYASFHFCLTRQLDKLLMVTSGLDLTNSLISIKLIHSSSMQHLGLWSWTTMIKPHSKLSTLRTVPLWKCSNSITPLFIVVTVIHKLVCSFRPLKLDCLI